MKKNVNTMEKRAAIRGSEKNADAGIVNVSILFASDQRVIETEYLEIRKLSVEIRNSSKIRKEAILW